MNQFTSARIKLTLFYSLTILLISGVVSGLFYYRTSQVIESEYNRIERRLQMQMRGIIPPPADRLFIQRIEPEDLERAKHAIIVQLLLINGLIVAVVAGGGYLLSGLTLRPIQRSMEEQQRFIGDAAHELRTPITALKTSLEVNLMDQKIKPATRNILRENLEDVVHLENLTNELLKLAKMSDQPLVLQPVQLAGIMERAVKSVAVMAKKKQIDITVREIPTHLQVKGNEAALRDLFTILVDNAIKYSPPNTHITIRTVTHQQAVTVRVKDQGMGIAQEHLAHIFDRFYQVDPARSQNGERSYGLGLAVAQKIIHHHGGLITVQSEAGKGSTFTVTLNKA